MTKTCLTSGRRVATGVAAPIAVRRVLLLTLAMLISLAGPWPVRAADRDALPLESIPSLDLTRYLGRWYEIAKFPNWFQRKCVADTSAHYSILSAGRVRVTNRCRLESGKMDEALGVARQTGSETSSRLEVRFAPDWLAFLPLVWGNYWVIDLDPEYQLVAISEPKREYLWILSRTPRVEPGRYARLLERLKLQGLDLDRLETTRQSDPPDGD